MNIDEITAFYSAAIFILRDLSDVISVEDTEMQLNQIAVRSSRRTLNINRKGHRETTHEGFITLLENSATIRSSLKNDVKAN
ncbi:hypothetical protein CEXT_789641 [Caerostris extrusa]|uniref:Uncharacterized protein n=1 Tax=Caerostris extrusa TaxID=172846 RepID=A0AAV4PUD5_CAEEX|nr:hypothetical protein CEXT_789641 [Caerostris extrusa]